MYIKAFIFIRFYESNLFSVFVQFKLKETFQMKPPLRILLITEHKVLRWCILHAILFREFFQFCTIYYKIWFSSQSLKYWKYISRQYIFPHIWIEALHKMLIHFVYGGWKCFCDWGAWNKITINAVNWAFECAFICAYNESGRM